MMIQHGCLIKLPLACQDWEIETEVLNGWEDAQSVLGPLLHMVICGRAPRVLFEPLLLNVVADNVSKEIRNLVARAMKPKRKPTEEMWIH